MKYIYIMPEVYSEIMFHVRKSDIEISGLGRVQRAEDGTMVVTKCYLLDQENSAVTTDICPEAMAKLQYETRDDEGDLNFWWHSHVNMGTSWSGTDTDTMEEFGKNGYLLSTVFNKRNEMRTAYYQGDNGFLAQCFIDDIETRIEYIPSKEQIEKWTEEHEDKCTKKQFPVGRVVGQGTWKNTWNKNTAHNQGDFFDDPDNPANFNDPHYWNNGEGEESTDTRHFTYSGANFEGIIQACEQDVRLGLKFEDLAEGDDHFWWDMYEIMSKNTPNENKVKRLYNRCIKDADVFQRVCVRFLENADKLNIGTLQ